jgi:ribosomal protein S18 acetylase RimI-like enzyme
MFDPVLMTVKLRPVRENDDAFLLKVYASTRADEMTLVPWSAEQKDAFVRMQFNAQRQSYLQQFPEAKYDIILRGDEPIGRLIVNRAEDAILLMDIALLPEYRGAGIGTVLIRDLQTEAAQVGKPLRIHVETFNPALRLYERLEFSKIGESGIYYEMEWHPGRE